MTSPFRKHLEQSPFSFFRSTAQQPQQPISNQTERIIKEEEAARIESFEVCTEWVYKTSRYFIKEQLNEIGKQPNKFWFLLSDLNVRKFHILKYANNQQDYLPHILIFLR